uniref:Coiled-coil domain containing 173 n=1 Tax=Astyanax mexicanus TaxID=7994 RepID=A0A3B1IJW3_ASTMX
MKVQKCGWQVGSSLSGTVSIFNQTHPEHPSMHWICGKKDISFTLLKTHQHKIKHTTAASAPWRASLILNSERWQSATAAFKVEFFALAAVGIKVINSVLHQDLFIYILLIITEASAIMDSRRQREDQRQEAISRAKDIFFYQSERVRQFRSTVGLSEIQKDIQAEIERKRKEKMKNRLQKELLEKSLLQQKKKEQEMELCRALQKQVEEKKELLAGEALRKEQEEKRQKLFLDSKDQQAKLQLEKREQQIRERQERTELVTQSMEKHQLQKQPLDEDLLISKAKREDQAKIRQLQSKKEEMKAVMTDSIKEYTKASRKEKERLRLKEKRDDAELLASYKEADRKFLKEQKIKAQKKREKGKEINKFNALQMAEKQELEQRLKQEDLLLESRDAQLIKEEEERFQRYAERCIQSAEAAGRSTYTLRKAAQRGVGGGLGPVIDGARSRYLDPEPRPISDNNI